MKSEHTVRVNWADGKQSIIELPEKLFMIFSVLLKGQQVVTDASAQAESSEPLPAQPGVTEKILDLASSVIQRGKHEAPARPQLSRMLSSKSRSSPRSTTLASSRTRSSRRRRLSCSSVSDT